MFRYIDCIDSGTEYCPCFLAEIGECIICSQLKNKVFCDCLNWRGTCIYQEFVWNNNKGKKVRQYNKYNIIHKEFIYENLLLLQIKVDRNLAKELNNIGAFVFLKCFSKEDSYGTPISILDSDIVNNVITVAIKIDGIKTKALSKCEDKIMIKGPYWNGLQGREYLKDRVNSKVLIVGGGIAIAPAVMAAKKLSKKNNTIDVILGKGRKSENFARKYFLNYTSTVKDINYYDSERIINLEGRTLIKEKVENEKYDVVLSAGDDKFHMEVLNFIHPIDKNIKFVTVNNSTMCCGDGICGSCIIRNKNNEGIKACKQQYNPSEIFIKEMDIE